METGKSFKTCRLCLSANDSLIHVFESRIYGYEVADVIIDLLRLEVSETDKYPQYVCGGCLEKLRDFKKFKEQCEACKVLLDRAYDAKSELFMDIKTNEMESDTIHLCTTTGDDSQIPNKGQEEETDPFSDLTDIKPSVLELNGELFGVKDEHGDTGSNNEMEYDIGPICTTTGDDSQIPNKEHVVFFQEEETDPLGDFTEIKPSVLELNDALSRVKEEPREVGFNNEAEVEGNPTCDDSDNMRLSCVLEWEVVPGVPASESVRDMCEVDGDLKDSEDSQDASDTNDEVGEVKRKLFQCSECGKKYSCPRSYHRHMDVHKFGKTSKCAQCDKHFASEKLLSVHMRSHSDCELVCDLCGKNFKNKQLMKSHLLHMHGDKNFKCEVCGRGFVSIGLLNYHKKVHTKGGNHACDICGKVFGDIISFNKHMHNHKYRGRTKKKYACGVCDLKCIHPSQLVIHMRTHTKERPFPCPTCGACFSVKQSLKYHIKSKHTECGVMQLQCEKCGRKYSRIQNLKQHIKVSHMGLKEFKCQNCTQEFTRKHNLLTHMRKYHS